MITKGIVQEKQQARDTYNAAIAKGDGAQLLEQKRTDVFELVSVIGSCMVFLDSHFCAFAGLIQSHHIL